MATTAVSSWQIAMSRLHIPSSQRNTGAAVLCGKSEVRSWNKLASVCHVSSVQHFQRGTASCSIKFDKVKTKAMSESSENKTVSGLPIDLKGYTSFVLT